MIPEEDELQFGKDISTWPMVKLRRAAGLLAEVDAQVGVWNASRRYIVPVRIAQDRSHLEFIAPQGLRPPLEEWSLVFGEALHQARSALDAFVWEVANLNGAVPKHPRNVAMPITTAESEWRARTSKMESIAPWMLERLREVQPWVHGEESPEQFHWLLTLARLNNADKHQAMVLARPAQESIEVEGGFKVGEPTADGEAYSIFTLGPLGEPGSVFGRLGMGRVLEQVGPMQAHVVVTAAVDVNGQAVPLHAFGEMLSYLGGLLEFLRSGSWQSREHAAEEPDGN